MNKYDATQAWSAGSATKLSMDYQQTASNQFGVSTGTRNIHDNADSIKHEGTTFMRNENGELLRMTGTYEQTGGAWKFSGNVQNLTTGETYTGNVSDTTKDMNSMQQGLNVDDISMTGKERANLGDVKGNNVAFMQGTVVDSKLSASDVINEDNVRTADTVDSANYTFTRKTTQDTSTTIDKSYTEKDNHIKENKNIDDSSTTINKSYTENDSKNIVSGTKTSVGDTVNDYTGGLAMLQNGLSKFGANQGLMKEAFVDNMTKYQNSIMSEQGRNTLSLDKAFGIAGDANASVGGKIFGTGLQAFVSAELSAIAKEGSGQISSADLNRVMNSAILEQLDIDAKNNNWTAEQYDQAAKERFGAYNDFLKNELGGQVYGWQGLRLM